MRYKRIMEANVFWLLLLFVVDGFFAALLWLANAAAFAALVPVIFLATVLLFSVICVVIRARDKRRKQAFLSFLETPDKEHEELLSGVLDVSKKDAVCILGRYCAKNRISTARRSCIFAITRNMSSCGRMR